MYWFAQLLKQQMLAGYCDLVQFLYSSLSRQRMDPTLLMRWFIELFFRHFFSRTMHSFVWLADHAIQTSWCDCCLLLPVFVCIVLSQTLLQTLFCLHKARTCSYYIAGSHSFGIPFPAVDRLYPMMPTNLPTYLPSYLHHRRPSTLRPDRWVVRLPRGVLWIQLTSRRPSVCLSVSASSVADNSNTAAFVQFDRASGPSSRIAIIIDRHHIQILYEFKLTAAERATLFSDHVSFICPMRRMSAWTFCSYFGDFPLVLSSAEIHVLCRMLLRIITVTFVIVHIIVNRCCWW